MPNSFSVNQLYTMLNAASSEAFGASALAVKDAGTFVALGNYVMTGDNKDLFTGAFTNLIGKTVISNRAYTTNTYPFLVDKMEFGSIYRKIKVWDPTLMVNLEWDLDAQSDQFDFTPINAKEYLFQKMGTWSKMVSIHDFQVKTAFESSESMMAFYASIYTQIETAIVVAIESLNRLALSSYTAEKINLQTTQPTKIHAINVLDLYNTTFTQTLTAAKCYTDKEFMRFFSRLLKLYKTRLKNLSVSFNNTDLGRFTSEEYLDIYVLADVASGFAAYLESDTFNKELVSLPTYHEVSFWQAPGVSYESTSAVNIKLASDPLTTVSKSNVLAVMVDREAIATNFDLETTETARDARKKITNHIRSATKGMMLDLGENGIVFYAED